VDDDSAMPATEQLANLDVNSSSEDFNVSLDDIDMDTFKVHASDPDDDLECRLKVFGHIKEDPGGSWQLYYHHRRLK
jgi:hypothetical protein